MNGRTPEETESVPRERPVAGMLEEGPPARRPDGHPLKHDYSPLIGRSSAMTAMLRLVDRATDVDVPVLIQGESGTGKELIARCLHVNGPRRDRPFVAVNCAAIPETLLESEFFGHERGAFTGAHRDRAGNFVTADTGTLFLDEIGEMAPALQAKLLRVIQDGVVYPLGGSEPRRVDVRLVCAANRDLARLVREGRFREDLYYRINVIRVTVPPLRERREDLKELCRHFLQSSGKSLTPPALEAVLRYSWPGNVRELANVMERAAVVAPAEAIGVEHLDLPAAHADLAPPLESLEHFLNRATRGYLQEVLRRAGGCRRRTAAILGIDRTTLYRLMKKLGIER